MRTRKCGTRPLIGAGAPVLRRVLDISAEPVGGVPGPARIVEEGSGKRHAVGAAVGDDRFCLVRIDNHPDRLEIGDRHGDRGTVRWDLMRPSRQASDLCALKIFQQ